MKSSRRPGNCPLEIFRNAEPEGAARPLPVEMGDGLPLQREKLAGVGQQRLAVGRQPDGVGIAIDEPAPEGAFQPLDVLADGRLAEAEPLGRQGEASRLRHHDEAAQLHEVEHIAIPDKCYRLHRKTG